MKSAPNFCPFTTDRKLGPAVVQCKLYREGSHVGTPEIQQLIGSMQIYGIKEGFFVATTRFSPQALKLAAAYGIQPIDDQQLMLLVRKAFPRQ